MFWFWLKLLFDFELVFSLNLWDFSEIDLSTETYGHQPRPPIWFFKKLEIFGYVPKLGLWFFENYKTPITIEG